MWLFGPGWSNIETAETVPRGHVEPTLCCESWLPQRRDKHARVGLREENRKHEDRIDDANTEILTGPW